MNVFLLQVNFLLLLLPSTADYPTLILSKYVKIHSDYNQDKLNSRKQLLIEESNLSISKNRGSEVLLLIVEEEEIDSVLVRSLRRKDGFGKGREGEQLEMIEQVEGDLVEQRSRRMARSVYCP